MRIRCSTPGLEHVASAELQRKLNASIIEVQPGNVECTIDCSAMSPAATRDQLYSLHSVEHIFAVLYSGRLPSIMASESATAEAALEHITDAIINGITAEQWRGALALWASCLATDSSSCTSTSIAKLSFKVTKRKVCAKGKNKTGKLLHPFNSTQLAQSVFKAVQAVHNGWEGVLDDPDLTIFVRVAKTSVLVCIPLCPTPIWEATPSGGSTRRLFSKGNRNLGVKTPLKPTIAYPLVHCAGNLDGTTDIIVVDPCCGSGTVGECACLDADGVGSSSSSIGRDSIRRPVFVVSGDMDEAAVRIAADNAGRRRCAIGRRRQCLIDVVRWDAANLPLRDNIVDRIASDLPFGRKCGSRRSNRCLYPRLFRECARVLRPMPPVVKGGGAGSGGAERTGGDGEGDRERGGVATILSCDRMNLLKGVEGSGLKLWSEYVINIGGLNGAVLVLEKASS